jgi:hypothetical protein
MARPRLRTLWRHLLRAERPRQSPAWWRGQDLGAVLLVCLLVALVSSWPWLVEPNLRAGMVAPFTVRAPQAAQVVDSTALEQRRQQMRAGTTVQGVDEAASPLMRERREESFDAGGLCTATREFTLTPGSDDAAGQGPGEGG